ncbi:MAG: alpha/beta hydrolase [Pseudomonadota bacterium]|nr:alpha/beta hydrolase [Pseudomonadota bacterium]
MNPVRRRVETPAGTIDLYQVGDGAEPVLMLHASGTGAGSLLALAGLLASPDRTLLVPFFDGYGATRVAGATGRDRHLAVIRDLLATLPGPPRVFGHSMGGFMAMLAAAGGASFRSLVVVEPVALGVLAHDPADCDILAIDRRAVAAIAPRMAAGDPEGAIREFISLWNGMDWDRIPEKVRAGILALAPAILADTSAVSFDETPAAYYAAIACPVRLVGTEHGPVPAAATLRRLGEALPGAGRATVAGAGHMGPVQRPDLFAGLAIL